MRHTKGPVNYEGGIVTHPTAGTILLADRSNPGTSPAERDHNLKFAASCWNLVNTLKHDLAHLGFSDPDAAISGPDLVDYVSEVLYPQIKELTE